MKRAKKVLLILLTLFCTSINILILTGFIYYALKFKEFKFVSFNSNGGTIVENIIVRNGTTIDLPSNLEKTGFEFLGWEIDGRLVSSPITIEKNINLIAKWETVKIHTYTIRFLNENGSLYSRQLVKENGLAYSPKKPLKSGFTFEYWSLNGEKFDFSIPITSDLELYPVFIEKIEEDYEGIIDEGYDQTIIEN